jgi:sugar fermentation stimulation protein A
LSIPIVKKAKFVWRPNRFLGIVELNGELVETFIPNPGRMYELMVPGKTVYIRENSGKHRKTSYDMIAVKHAGTLISIDSNLPNRFMKQMLKSRELSAFAGYDSVKAEPSMYEGRFDFLLSGEQTTVIEVKSCTLVVDGRAIFPDAPTARGARHMHHLAQALHDKLVDQAAVVFVIQRPDAEIFSPNDPTDSTFADNLRAAHDAGVQIIPILTEVIDWGLSFKNIIPYDLFHFTK